MKEVLQMYADGDISIDRAAAMIEAVYVLPFVSLAEGYIFIYRDIESQLDTGQ
jgi:hypothetical protein